jgi:hypothetical protein
MKLPTISRNMSRLEPNRNVLVSSSHIVLIKKFKRHKIIEKLHLPVDYYSKYLYHCDDMLCGRYADVEIELWDAYEEDQRQHKNRYWGRFCTRYLC